MITFSLDIRAEQATAAIRNRAPQHVLIASEECPYEGSTMYNIVYDNDVQGRVHRLEDAMFVYGYTRGQGIGCTLMID
jgi:hypothetical protein